MTSEDELKIIRRAYAKQVLAAMQVSDERVEDAFAAIRREDFLGTGPWPILRYERYVPTPAPTLFTFMPTSWSAFCRNAD